MKKALLAASIAMMCAGASAQSYVQIYGRMNLSIEHQKDGPTDSNQVQNNSSRWGLIGNEDLGGGMKAFFNLEQGFDASNGASTVAGTTFSRESFVGLGSKYGEIRMGAFTSPLYLATADYVSMHNHDTGTSSDAFFDNDGGLGVGGGAAGGYPTKNAISLKSPSFSGLTFEYVHGYAEDVANRGGLDTISFNYDGGALQIGGGYGHQDTLGNFGHSEILALRALYDFGNFVLGGYIEQDRFGDADRTNIRLSGMVPVGNHEFHLNYGQASDVQGHTNSGARQGTVGYNYNFSKRTKVYAFFTLVQNDDNAAYYVSTPGKTFRSLALGLRHNF